MSAFIVTYGTIDNIVAALIPSAMTGDESATAKGRDLLRANADSVIYRYNEDADQRQVYNDYINGYEYVEQKQDDVQNLKSMNCWLYQSCEKDEIMEGKLYRRVEWTSQDFTDKLSRGNRLMFGEARPYVPNYDEAKWDMPRKAIA